jgi:branched-chain amino acid transport system substrate-binding protein
MINKARRSMLLSYTAAATLVCPSYGLAARGATGIGLSLPLTGPQAEVAKEMLAGYEIAAQESGGQVRLMVLDDESKPERTVQNVKTFAADTDILALSGIVGTPHAQAAIPIAVQLGLPIVGIRSGAKSIRDGKQGVYHLRATFEEELAKVAQLCQGGALSRVAILYSSDSFGTTSRDYLVARLQEMGIDGSLAVAVERNGENLSQAAEKVAMEIKRSSLATGVALLLISKPMMQAAKILRERHNVLMPIFAMSFTATKGLATSEDPAFNGLGLVTAFPLPRSSVSRLATQFRADAMLAKRENVIESLAALEGYFYGLVAVKAATGASDRGAFVRRLESGLVVASTPIQFDASRNGYSYLEVVHKGTGDRRLRA